MARLRRDTRDNQFFTPFSKPLRIVASGTLFLTHTLEVPCHPAPSTVIRAHSVTKTRGGSASSLLSLLAQFPSVDAALVASLGGNEEGQMLIQNLEHEGVNIRYCKVYKESGVPSAWVLHAADNNSRTVINHNPLPDITHEEFVSILGPLLAPENYMISPSPSSSPVHTAQHSNTPTPSPTASSPFALNPNSPAPFDWLHFEGRSVKTTLSNISGLDGLARERKWRSHCVFSVDVGRRGRQGVEALIPYADVLFLNKHYAQAHSPHYATTPRAFLLSLTSIAPPHALLVAHWGSEGGAVLSLPTKEYFQCSGWVEERPPPPQRRVPRGRQLIQDPPSISTADEVRSVRTGSDFWADGRSHTPSSSAFTTTRDNSAYLGDSLSAASEMQVKSRSRSRGPINPESGGHQYSHSADYDEDDNDSQGTEVPDEDDGVIDEIGAQDAFVSGMIYALSRRLTPGPPYTPSSGGEDESPPNCEGDKARWKLDDCLRFATELSGRKARRRHWGGLADEMARAGWFDV